ncbi:conserved hypothetical protein [Histoplasma capsulatum var. duboisii H88]|uniref:Uncharacterized protein n=2 Tax=Ajellomyces capsulatus TaxID=5037 RepID=F0UFL4_AJEC8|nr:conserved hypothetical protein [Histoplasma capsulatum H143]EGC44966.1 conserved hypothetical protein [Histoplasma capsulatum var. duboisii H88]
MKFKGLKDSDNLQSRGLIVQKRNFLNPDRHKLSRMKLSGAAVLALLASSTTAASWNCHASGGGGHQTLLQLHGQFNRLFGNSKLHIASDQCYYAKCNRHYFGVCNRASYTKWEKSGDRNVAKNANPGGGSACAISPSPVQEPYLVYIFSHEKDISIGGRKNDIRYC